jgi:hypothetical protein
VIVGSRPLDQADQPRPVVAVAGAEDLRGVEDDPRHVSLAHRLLAEVLAALVVDPALAATLRHRFVEPGLHQMREGRH